MILICSAGGVGTTSFIKWAGRYSTVNSYGNKDGLKHSVHPPERKGIEKAVYLFTRKPEEAAVSLVKRFNESHIRKLTGENLILRDYRKLLGYNRDLFDFESVFKNWFYSATSYDILFLNYDTMWYYVKDVAEFLEFPEEAIIEFPKFKKRNSAKLLEQEQQLYYHLNSIYNKFKYFLYDLPDFYVKDGGLNGR